MLSIKRIGQILENRQNNKVVLLGGCFDILHIGHLRYLKKAKKLGNILIVGINDDKFIKKTKGKHRPHVPEKQRAEVLLGLKHVDYVFITRMALYDYVILKAIKPDILVFANEPDKIQKRKLAAKNINTVFPKIQIKFLSSGVKNISTSLIENKIKKITN